MTFAWQVGSGPRWQGGEPVDAPVDGRDADGYADLRTYATIGDGRTVALVSRGGSIDWLPLPAIDSPPPFAALLDAPAGGAIRLAPVEEHTSSRRYVDGGNVLETTFTTASGVVKVTDSLNTGLAGRLPWCELARRIDGVSGHVRMRGEIAPGTLLGAASPWASDTVHGTVLRLDGLTLAPRTLHDAGVDVEERRVVAVPPLGASLASGPVSCSAVMALPFDDGAPVLGEPAGPAGVVQRPDPRRSGGWLPDRVEAAAVEQQRITPVAMDVHHLA